MAVFISLLKILFPAASGASMAVGVAVFLVCLAVAYYQYKWIRFFRGR